MLVTLPRCKCVHTAVSRHVVSWVTRSQGITVTSSKEALDTVELKCKYGQGQMKYECLAEDIKIALAKSLEEKQRLEVHDGEV